MSPNAVNINEHLVAKRVDEMPPGTVGRPGAFPAGSTEGVGEAQSDGSHGSRDRWLSRGLNGDWIREHATPRTAMFTPSKIPRGAGPDANLLSMGITKGCNARGERFTIVDNWKDKKDAHKCLREPWTGTTSFITTSSKKVMDAMVDNYMGATRGPEVNSERISF